MSYLVHFHHRLSMKCLIMARTELSSWILISTIFLLDDLLHNLRYHRVFPDISTTWDSSFLDVLGCLSPDLICRPKCRIGSRSCNERPKWSIFGTCDVCTIPALLWILRILRRDTSLLALDHLFELHQIWIRRNSFGNLRFCQRETKMFPSLLPFQESRNHFGRIGYVGCWFYRRYHCSYCHIRSTKSCCLPVLEMETEDHSINYSW